MNKIHIVLLTLFCLLAPSAPAQDTNSLKTDLGVFETQTGTVLIKGFSQTGMLTVGTDVITVYCKESTDLTTGHKADGLAIVISGNTPPRRRILVDYDEIDSLLDSINYLNKISYDVTPLASFEASYSTRSGFRVVANSLRRLGAIQVSLEYGDDLKVLLTTDQMTQFYQLIELAKKNLDTLRNLK
jgi:hypothetical protein